MQSAEDLLAKAIERHGGLSALESINSITIRLERLAGSVPQAKGYGRTFKLPDNITIFPNQRCASFDYDDGMIRFEQGSIVTNESRIEKYRTTFKGLRKLRRWKAADACYFFGYALINYFCLPFSLRSLTVARAQMNDSKGAWLSVRFPKNDDTHSVFQRFWFDESGLLVRHDYRADILGPIFYGAHFSQDYRFDFPIPIAQRRVVKLRLGSIATPLVVLEANFSVEAID